MKWSEFFKSSIGKKYVMGTTGLFLISFLVIHVGLNATIWANDQGEMFNKGAHFMGTMIVIRLMEIVLFAGIILHTVQGLSFTSQNQSKRKIGYAVPMGSKGSHWYRKSMGLLGTLILLFLIMHIYHFWTPSRLGGIGGVHELSTVEYNGIEYHNLYAEMLKVFQDNILVVVIYVLGCISLAYHLAHGFQSAFKTMGVYNGKYLSLLNNIGLGFSVIVSGAFAMMPVSMYLGWVS
ncbi:MAG: succinate dehydrogenase [Chitinophagaceae bacterium]|nr:MAG: succinate dehydrogenase [Chitinophagaceae bacterium]